MKKGICVLLVLIIMFSVSACGTPAVVQTASETTAATASPAVTTAQDAVNAASADELRGMISQYKDEGNYEMLYAAASRLIELDPSDADAYIAASDTLLAMAEGNVDQINQLLAQGAGSVDDVKSLTDWAMQHQPSFTVEIPFLPDYTSADEINTDGITTGNQTNAGKYNGTWRGGLMTWQGEWVYLSQPNENFAIYKMRSDGSEYQRVGDACGSSLNVIGDWIYFINTGDGDKPYKMRTDGSMMAKLIDDGCSFLSVESDYMYYDNGSDGGCLYKTGLDGSESVKLADVTAMFTCAADGYVYYCPKSMDGGLCRVSEDGGESQLIATGFIQNYCVADDWVYYINANNTDGVRRVRTDGTGDEMFFPFDSRITAINVADGTLYICFNLGYEEDGFLISTEIVTIDIGTLAKKMHVEADTEPLCVGPDGWFYYFYHGQGIKWVASDQNGMLADLG